MDLTWLKDYGALAAASIAAGVAILNSVLQARRDRRFKTDTWLRELRTQTYVSFIRSVNDYRTAIFWNFAEPDREVTGPPPETKPDFDAMANAFRQALAEVTMVGPAAVATAATIVQYACWRYLGLLEEEPWNYDQRLTDAALNDFIREAQIALSMEPTGSIQVAYREWVKSLPANEE